VPPEPRPRDPGEIPSTLATHRVGMRGYGRSSSARVAGTGLGMPAYAVGLRSCGARSRLTLSFAPVRRIAM